MVPNRSVAPVVGGYLVHGDRVLLLWHADLKRWVPAGGRVESSLGEYPHEALEREVKEECGLGIAAFLGSGIGINDNAVRSLPSPVAAQEIALPDGGYYFDLVYYCTAASESVSLNYEEARAFHWFTRSDLEAYPLLPHVRHHSHSALAAVPKASS